MITPLLAGLAVGCGLLVLIGFFTRLATLPLLTMILIVLTLIQQPGSTAQDWWRLLYEARTGYCMLLGTFFLFWLGAGSFSLDAWLTANRRRITGKTVRPPVRPSEQVAPSKSPSQHAISTQRRTPQ